MVLKSHLSLSVVSTSPLLIFDIALHSFNFYLEHYTTDIKPKAFVELNDKKCKILLSNSDTPFIRRLYSDFSKCIKEINVSRAINCKASKRIGHKELLISNYSS